MQNKKTETKSFPHQVWETLSAINVNEKAEKKMGLTYLSWAWAWNALMEHYPENTYQTAEEKYFPNGSCEVGVTVTVKDGDNEISRYMWLPVLDHNNKAVPNPDAFLINKNKMRCLVKCISMFGLGLYIYAGEDLPKAELIAKIQSKADGYTNQLKQAKNEEVLKTILAQAWRDEVLGNEQRRSIKACYDKRKEDFKAAENPEKKQASC